MPRSRHQAWIFSCRQYGCTSTCVVESGCGVSGAASGDGASREPRAPDCRATDRAAGYPRTWQTESGTLGLEAMMVSICETNDYFHVSVRRTAGNANLP